MRGPSPVASGGARGSAVIAGLSRNTGVEPVTLGGCQWARSDCSGPVAGLLESNRQKKCVRARHVANPMRRIASPLSSNIACIRLNRHKGSSADESHGPWTDGRQRRVSGLCCGSERLRDLLRPRYAAS